MPLLFAIGVQGALEEVAAALLPGEQLCAFLDDLYILWDPSRVKVLYDLLATTLHRVAGIQRGIQLHQGKTSVWNKAGIPPQNVEDLGPEVWQATERDHGAGNTHRVRTVHLGEIGRALGQRKGSLESDPHGARLAVRMADTAPERQPEGEPHNAHEAGIWNTAKVLLDVHPEGETPTVGNPPNEDGRAGAALGRAVRTICILGVVGGRTAHDQRTHSRSGRNAGVAFAQAPTTAECTIPPHLFRLLPLERLQLPVPVTEATCNGCHEPMDTLGRHRAACRRSGRVKKRAGPTERVLARVCREAGARVKFNAALRHEFGCLGSRR